MSLTSFITALVTDIETIIKADEPVQSMNVFAHGGTFAPSANPITVKAEEKEPGTMSSIIKGVISGVTFVGRFISSTFLLGTGLYTASILVSVCGVSALNKCAGWGCFLGGLTAAIGIGFLMGTYPLMYWGVCAMVAAYITHRGRAVKFSASKEKIKIDFNAIATA